MVIDCGQENTSVKGLKQGDNALKQTPTVVVVGREVVVVTSIVVVASVVVTCIKKMTQNHKILYRILRLTWRCSFY